MTEISVFGLGYVGAVSAACLAKDGHKVIGVDPNTAKVDLINRGLSPIVEDGLDSLIQVAHASRRLNATSSASEAIAQTEISLICVGTPSRRNGDLDVSFIENVCAEVGQLLRHKSNRHILVFRSTMLPGAMREVVIPILERESASRAGEKFDVCINPEFLREGSAIDDYFNPPKIVIGEDDSSAGDATLALYKGLDAPVIRVSLETAELIKYTDNAWHALKIGFANEIGSLCKACSVDGVELMDAFCKDTKLNISSAYLKPGFAFGGSCLPKDLRALNYRAKSIDLDLPILSSILASNELQIQRAVEMIEASGVKRILILGLAFKAGTDDMRESPLLEMVQRLLGRGYEISIYDRYVNLSRLTGANQAFLMQRIPHVSRLLTRDIDASIVNSELIVIGTPDPEFGEIVRKARPEQKIIDFVRLDEALMTRNNYEGVAW